MKRWMILPAFFFWIAGCLSTAEHQSERNEKLVTRDVAEIVVDAVKLRPRTRPLGIEFELRNATNEDVFVTTTDLNALATGSIFLSREGSIWFDCRPTWPLGHPEPPIQTLIRIVRASSTTVDTYVGCSQPVIVQYSRSQNKLVDLPEFPRDLAFAVDTAIARYDQHGRRIGEVRVHGGLSVGASDH